MYSVFNLIGFIRFQTKASTRDVDTASIREKVVLNPNEKWRILKNIVIISFSFMIQFTAFQVNYLSPNSNSNV